MSEGIEQLEEIINDARELGEAEGAVEVIRRVRHRPVTATRLPESPVETRRLAKARAYAEVLEWMDVKGVDCDV